MEKKNEKLEKEMPKIDSCNDVKCPFHGELKTRGRIFYGYVKRKFPKRVVIEFERTIYIRKYERYTKKRTRIHARLPACLDVNVGDYIKVQECRPLSRMIHFAVIENLGRKTK